MEIGRPQIITDEGQAVYQVSVKSLQGDKTLRYSLPEEFVGLVSGSSDAALVALLLPAMARGEDIRLEGEVSERLFYNVSGPLQKLLRLAIPHLEIVKVYPSKLNTDLSDRPGVVTGFSGGIDSFCVLAEHLHDKLPPGFTITHLLYNNVGSHGWGGSRLFKERYQKLRPVTERMGLPFIPVDTNIEAFYGGKDYLRFESTHTLRNASVAVLLQKGVQRYMYASAYHYSNVFFGPTKNIAYLDCILLPMLRTENLDTMSVGSEYTRVEKTIRVSEITHSYNHLDVCVEPEEQGKNCSRCWKCLRTLLTFDIAGVLENYSLSFDISVYKSHRNAYIEGVLKGDDPFSREIIDFAKVRDYDLV